MFNYGHFLNVLQRSCITQVAVGGCDSEWFILLAPEPVEGEQKWETRSAEGYYWVCESEARPSR